MKVESDFVVTIGSKGAVAVLAVFAQSCLAWFLGPEGRGAFAVCQVFAAVLIALFLVGCNVAGPFFVASKRMSLSDGISNTAMFGFASSMLAIVTGLAALEFPLSFIEKAGRDPLILSLCTIPTTVISMALVLLLTAVGQFQWYALLTAIQWVVYVALLLLFVGQLDWGVEGALLAVVLRGIVLVVLTIVVFVVKLKISWRKPTLHGVREMVKYGGRYYFGKIGSTANTRLGTVVLSFFASNAEIGVFATASQLASHVMQIPQTLTTVLLPKVAADGQKKAGLVAFGARLTGVVCFVVLGLLVVFAEPIVRLLFSDQFMGAVPVLRVLAVGVGIRATCKSLLPFLLGTDHPGLASVASLAGAVVNLSTMCFLLPTMGIVGAAAATTLGHVFSSMILVRAFCSTSGMTVWKLLRFRKQDSEVITGRGAIALRQVAHMLSRKPGKKDETNGCSSSRRKGKG